MLDGANPPIVILLCSDKNHALVEYALDGMDNNLFVSKYLLELPKKDEIQAFIEEQVKDIAKSHVLDRPISLYLTGVSQNT